MTQVARFPESQNSTRTGTVRGPVGPDVRLRLGKGFSALLPFYRRLRTAKRSDAASAAAEGARAPTPETENVASALALSEKLRALWRVREYDLVGA